MRILDLEENYLETIPNEVGRLRELTRLVLQSNALVQLPRAIGQLSSLQYLSVGENYLSFLPEVNTFPVSLRNRKISGGLEPVLRHTEKICIASYYIQFSTNIKMYKPILLARAFGISGVKNLVHCTFLYSWKVVYNTKHK